MGKQKLYTKSFMPVMSVIRPYYMQNTGSKQPACAACSYVAHLKATRSKGGPNHVMEKGKSTSVNCQVTENCIALTLVGDDR